MGIFRFSGVFGVDMMRMSMSGVGDLPVSAYGPTRVVLFDDVWGSTLTATGTGFVFNVPVDSIREVIGGTLSSLVAVNALDWQPDNFRWTDLNLAMDRVALLLAREDFEGFYDYVLSRADRIVGTGGDDVLTGLAGNDTLFGSGGADLVRGDTGNDQLNGGAANDTLSGGTGADTLLGGVGADSLIGDGGRDVFVFNTAASAVARDTISGFVSADDVIHLDNAVFTAFANVGTMVQSRFHLGVAAADAGDRIIYDRAEGALSYDRDGTGSAQAVVFAQVQAGTALGYQDIVII